jgi:hypothetical protein
MTRRDLRLLLVLAATIIPVGGCSVIVSTEGLAGGSSAQDDGTPTGEGGSGVRLTDAGVPSAPTKVDGGQVGPPTGSSSGGNGTGGGSGSSSGGNGTGGGSSSSSGGGIDASVPDTGSADTGVVDTGPPDTGAPSVCSTGRARVFVTSAFHTPDFGGIGGGDAVCQKTADGAKLGNKWRVWLADPNTAAVAHIYAAPKGYVLLDGTVVATSIGQLTAPPLSHSINRNELGNVVNDGQTEVWTGYDPAANTYAGICNNGGGPWTSATSAADTPFVGHLDGVDDSWSAAYLQFCDRSNVRLYCFEVCP